MADALKVHETMPVTLQGYKFYCSLTEPCLPFVPAGGVLRGHETLLSRGLHLPRGYLHPQRGAALEQLAHIPLEAGEEGSDTLNAGITVLTVSTASCATL